MAYKDKDLEGYGGATEIPKWNPDHVLCVADKDHPLYSPSRAYRYLLDDRQSIEDMDSIDKLGVITPAKACVRTIAGNEIHVIIFGSRRTVLLREVNRRRIERGDKPYLLPMVIDNRITDAEWIDQYIDENERRKGNDPMTCIETADMMLRKNVSEEAVLKRFSNIFRNPGEMRRAVKEGGLLESDRAVKEAVARWDLPLDKALALVKRCPDKEAQAGVIEAYLVAVAADDEKGKARALQGKPISDEDDVEKAPRVTWERMTVGERDALIALVDGSLSSKTHPITEPGTRALFISVKCKLEKLPVKKDKEPAAS